MADVKISALPTGSALSGTEIIPVVQGGDTVKTTTGQIKDLVVGSGENMLVDKEYVDAKDAQLSADLNTFNATYKVPLAAGQYYNLGSAIAAVPASNRKVGLKLEYLDAMREVETLTVTSIPTIAGNVSITLNGVTFDIPLNPAIDTTATLVANKIRSASFTGWSTSGSGASIGFSRALIGACSAPFFNPHLTGCAADFAITVAGTFESVMDYQFNGSSISSFTTQSNWRRVINEIDLAPIAASVRAPETPVENNEKIDYLETKVNNIEKQLFSILAKNKGVENVEPRVPFDAKKEESVVLSSYGEFTTPATNSSARKPMFVIVEDDSIDRHYEVKTAESSCPELYPGGYFSRLHPVLASCGVKGCLAYIGSDLGFASEPPSLTSKGYMHVLLHEKYGWEMLNHSLHHQMYSAYEFASIDAANSSGFNTAGKEIYIPSTTTNYIYNGATSTWDLTSNDRIQPFIKSATTGLLLYDNPTFNMNRQYRWNQLMGEKFGLGAVRNFIFPGETDSHLKRTFIKKTHNVLQGYSGFNVGTSSRIIPPLSCLLPRYILANPYPSSIYGEAYYNAWVNRQLTTWKDDVDSAIKEGASILYNIHSFRPMWENYNPSESEYNASWIIPTGTYGDANYDMPNSNTGLTNWSQWYPCPNTRLRDLYDLIKYIQSKGYEVVTLQEYYSRMSNLVSVGEFTNNNRSQIFENWRYPHYVVGVDGRSSYYNK